MADQPELVDPRRAEEDASRMPFLEHLRELRTRLRNAIIALIFGFGVAFYFAEDLHVLMMKPLVDVWLKFPELGPPTQYFTSLMDPFWTYFSYGFWAGIFLASPFIFHQIWMFIAPGLYKNERRIALPFAGISAIFFVGGALFCYFFVLPVVWEFFLGYATEQAGQHVDIGVDIALKPILTMREYLSLGRKLMLGFGLVFELPLLIFFLSAIGLVTHRSLWKFNRWWIVLSFILAAILTPPDPLSQTLMAVPLVLLYNVSIVIAYFVTKRREAAMAKL